MFRCTECSEEYKIEPDYCKCGNDEFEEITELQEKNISNGSKQISEKTESKIPLKLVFQISYIIFCIILAIIPWLFKTEKAAHTHEQTVSKTTQSIPDIENIWTDKIETPTPQPKPESQIAKNVENIINKVIEPKSAQKDTSAKTQPKTQQNKQVKKTVQNKNQTAKPAAEKPKLPPSVLNPKPADTPKSQPKPKPPQMNNQEFLQYKGEIRSALLSKLNITAVQGTGDCAVEFSIDNSGKLINRNFIYKSSNKSLNDEVYLMLMRLPYFKQPPQYYNGEKIRLKFYINNGYYEITFL